MAQALNQGTFTTPNFRSAGLRSIVSSLVRIVSNQQGQLPEWYSLYECQGSLANGE
jgi:hypothetical protein